MLEQAISAGVADGLRISAAVVTVAVIFGIIVGVLAGIWNAMEERRK